MKFLTNTQNQPLLQTNSGEIINLNTLENTQETDLFPVKAGFAPNFSRHKNDRFLDKAGKLFSVSKIRKSYGMTWYVLESQMFLVCIVNKDTIQLGGSYPVYYLKLLFRYINSL